jgi:hypothetical protein
VKVYIGDINTFITEKTEMPMLGGFLTVEYGNMELKTRASSATLIIRKVAAKKRLIFEFQNMLPDHFDTWVGQQRFIEWREVEYEEKDGSFTKVITNFSGNYLSAYKKTNHQWLYGQVSFTLEEV